MQLQKTVSTIRKPLSVPDGKNELGEEDCDYKHRKVLLRVRLHARPLELDLQPRVVQQAEGHQRLQDLVAVGGVGEQSACEREEMFASPQRRTGVFIVK